MMEFVAAPTTQNQNISTVTPVNIWSYTFDGNVAAPNPNNEFVPDVPSNHVSAVNFVPVGTDNGGTTVSGTGYIELDGDRLIAASIIFPDMDVEIIDPDAGDTNVRATGATLNLTVPELGGDDFSDNIIQVDGFNIATFQNSTVANFSTLSDVLVGGCTLEANGPGCSAIGYTNLDGIKYELERSGNTYSLKYWTNNGSIFMMEFVAAEETMPVNVPMPLIMLFPLGLLLIYINYRRKFLK